MEVLGFAVQLALNIAITAWIVRRDERRLDARGQARAWPTASLWAAVVTFGPLCLPVHFVRTRRSAWGLILGTLWMMGAFVVLSTIGAGFEAFASLIPSPTRSP